MGSPISGRGCVLQPAIVTKAIPPGGVGSGPSRWGQPSQGQLCMGGFPHLIGMKAFPMHLLCIPSGWGHPLGQVCLFVTWSRTKDYIGSYSFTMGPPILGSSSRIHMYSIGSKELLVADCCALVLLAVFWYLTVDCLLLASFAALLWVLGKLTSCPVVVHPPFA